MKQYLIACPAANAAAYQAGSGVTGPGAAYSSDGSTHTHQVWCARLRQAPGKVAGVLVAQTDAPRERLAAWGLAPAPVVEPGTEPEELTLQAEWTARRDAAWNAAVDAAKLAHPAKAAELEGRKR